MDDNYTFPDRPTDWQFDYSTTENVTDHTGVLRSPVRKSNLGALWEQFKKMQREQPVRNNNGQHANIDTDKVNEYYERENNNIG